MKVVLESKGIKTDTYYIPPFTLYEGEIIVLYLYNGQHFYDTEMYLKDIFCGVIKHENVTINRKMSFVDFFKESKFRDFFSPSSVNRFLKKNTDLTNPFLVKLFEDKYVTLETKMNKLGGTQRKLLSLYKMFSKTKDIVFDLVGLDSSGALLTFKLVEETIRNGGSAILLDGFEDMKEHTSKFITIQWNDGRLPLRDMIDFNL